MDKKKKIPIISTIILGLLLALCLYLTYLLYLADLRMVPDVAIDDVHNDKELIAFGIIVIFESALVIFAYGTLFVLQILSTRGLIFSLFNLRKKRFRLINLIYSLCFLSGIIYAIVFFFIFICN